jgi:hypothetical protein
MRVLPKAQFRPASLGWDPSVRSTIQHASRISNRVLLDAQRHQQTQAPKQATDTNVSNSATDLAEALGKNRETLQFDPPARDLTPVLRTPVEPAPLERTCP